MAAPDARTAKHRLVAETKRLLEAVALLDVADGDAAAVDALVERVAAAADAVAARPSLRATGLAGAPEADRALDQRSGISGFANPLAAPVVIRREGDRTYATATYGAAYEGPDLTLHGGFVAAAFDDLLGVAQQASGTAGLTGTLTIRMRRPTPLHTPIEYEAWVEKASGRKIVCKGTSSAHGEVTAEAECLFITPRDRSLPSGRPMR